MTTPPDDTTEGERHPTGPAWCAICDEPAPCLKSREREPDDTTAPVTAEDLREQMAEKLWNDEYLTPWSRAFGNSEYRDNMEVIFERVDALLALISPKAALAGDPGDLPARMAEAIRRHHNLDINNPEWSVGEDTCECGETVMDWDAHRAAAAMSVRWEDHVATVAQLERLRAELKNMTLSRNGAHAMMGVHNRRADRLRTELDHTKAALTGDDEGVRLFMADCEQRVERLKEQLRLADIDSQNADADRDRMEAERDLLRETLAESDLGAQVLAQWEAIAAADADRDRLEAELAEARDMFKRVCQGSGVFEAQLDLMTQMRNSEKARADALVAERDVFKTAIADAFGRWPDPFGSWTAEQADAARTMKTYMLARLNAALAAPESPEETDHAE
jgi:hypothetical protein